jgi:mannose-1-phosphate guanylyltransferase
MHTSGNVWAIVLAAGEGSRMALLTRALYGHDLPKQFAALDSEKTLLVRTMERVAPLVPPERTVVVVADAHETVARNQLADFPGVEIVTQPANLGTGPGILLPLAHVIARDPSARVVVFPSDHHVRRSERFNEAVERALRIAPTCESGVVLLGAVADQPSPDLGWIVRGARLRGQLGRAWRVQRFVEKPPHSVATRLFGMGSLWNTLVLAGSAQAIWQLAARHIAPQTELFERYLCRVGRPGVLHARAQLYRQLLPADFSRQVLQAADGLVVVALMAAGWFDCGTPERLLEWLGSSPEMEAQLRRIQAALARSGTTAVVPRVAVA